MKILCIPNFYPNEDNPMEALFNHRFVQTISLFNDVAVIFGKKNKKQKEPYRFHASKENGILTIRFTYRKTVRNWNYFSLYAKGVLNAFKMLGDKGFIPQIIQVLGFQGAMPATLLKKKTGIPFVVHDGQEEFIPSHCPSKKDRTQASFMREAAIIMPISNFLQQGFESYGIKGRFEIVPGKINSNIFFPPPDKNYDGKLKKIISVARLGFNKGIDDMLEALKLLKEKRSDFICRIIGGGEKSAEKYRLMAEEYNLSSQVFFLGRKSTEEVAELMRDSDFFLLPTHFESFGNVFLEAIASGLPIVGARVGGVAEYFGNPDFGILVPPKNIDLLAESLNYMFDHYSEYPTEQNARWAREKFGYETVGRQLVEIYRRVSQ